MKNIYKISFFVLVFVAGWNLKTQAQCQSILAKVTTSLPIDPVDSILKICQGTTVTFTGTATFSESAEGAAYDWKLNNVGGYSSTTSLTYTFDTEGVYLIDFLPTDAEGCGTTDCNSRQIVHVSATPRFVGTSVPDSVCLDRISVLSGIVTPVPQSFECAPPISDTTYLPDGSGDIYTTSIEVECFTACDTISSGTDIENLCLVIEHSYLGDLEIAIICPNGQQATVKQYPGGLSTYLGEPIDFAGSDGLVGVGWQYCFNDVTTNPTLIAAAAAGVGGGYITTGVGTPAGSSLTAGEYSPFESFDALIGCPLNGTWTIEVTDHMRFDDGYIFSWWIDFDIDSDSYSFENNYPTEYWTGPGVISPGTNPAEFRPVDSGILCYTYHVIDNFECAYDTTLCLYVKSFPDPGEDTSVILCPNFGTVNMFEYLGGTPDPGGLWTGPSILPDGVLTTTDLIPGTYEYIYTVRNTFCDTSATVTVEIKNALEVDFTFSYSLGCTEDTVHFQNLSEEDLTYIRWEFGDGSSIVGEENPSHIYSPQGEYSVWMVGINDIGCIDSVFKLVNTLHPIDAAFEQTADSLCQAQDNVVTFTDRSIGDIAAWNWYFGDGQTADVQNPDMTFTQYGLHEVMLVITDVLGCHDTAYSSIYVDSMTSLTVAFAREEICRGDMVNISSQYNTLISELHWDFGDMTEKHSITDELQHSYTETGQFIVTLTADHPVCPSVSAKDTILVKPYPMVNLGPDSFLCLKGAPLYFDPHALTSNPPHTRYIWSNGDSTSQTKITAPGTYSIIADLDGCITTDEFTVHKDCYIDIPNAFTPNGDGDNDYFFPRQYLSEGVIDFTFEIYNRWGEKLFSTSNPNGRGWDGRYNNEDQPVGVYVYQITVRYKNMTSEKYTGDVTLIR